jgi:hypothetical protein
MEHIYLVYTTPWTEGEVVASVHDSSFAIGFDVCSGEVLYGSLEKLMRTLGLNLRTQPDMYIAARCDYARYRRMYTDQEEHDMYQKALKEADLIKEDLFYLRD